MAASTAYAVCITGEFEDSLSKLGFEVYPLKVLCLEFRMCDSQSKTCRKKYSFRQVSLTYCLGREGDELSQEEMVAK